MEKAHSSGRTHGNNYPLLATWKTSILLNKDYNQISSEQLNTFGFQLTEANLGDSGKQGEQNYRSWMISTFYLGRIVHYIGKFQSKRDRTSSDGVTL